MKLSRKSEYALRALVTLANRDGGRPVPARALAEQNGIPKKFLEAILRELRDGGIVESTSGKLGGYRLARGARDIRLGEVLRPLDGRLDVGEVDPAETCEPLRRLIEEVGGEFDRLMDSTTLDDIVRGTPLRRPATAVDEHYIDGHGI